jgi:hypothetical protein
MQTRIEDAINNSDAGNQDYGTDVRVVRAYTPSGLYSWLTLSDGRDATYYTDSGRIVCHTPTPYAIDVTVPR